MPCWGWTYLVQVSIGENTLETVSIVSKEFYYKGKEAKGVVGKGGCGPGNFFLKQWTIIVVCVLLRIICSKGGTWKCDKIWSGGEGEDG